MKAKEVLICIVLLVCSVITVSLVLKSCQLSEKEVLQKENKIHEADIQSIQKKRDANNNTAIPFSDSARAAVVESVNSKNGFKLSVRKPKRN
jgi:hypothetical protein